MAPELEPAVARRSRRRNARRLFLWRGPLRAATSPQRRHIAHETDPPRLRVVVFGSVDWSMSRDSNSSEHD